MQEELATKLAQAALRGYFDQQDGFRTMDNRARQAAIKAVKRVLVDAQNVLRGTMETP